MYYLGCNFCFRNQPPTYCIYHLSMPEGNSKVQGYCTEKFKSYWFDLVCYSTLQLHPSQTIHFRINNIFPSLWQTRPTTSCPNVYILYTVAAILIYFICMVAVPDGSFCPQMMGGRVSCLLFTITQLFWKIVLLLWLSFVDFCWKVFKISIVPYVNTTQGYTCCRDNPPMYSLVYSK